MRRAVYLLSRLEWANISGSISKLPFGPLLEDEALCGDARSSLSPGIPRTGWSAQQKALILSYADRVGVDRVPETGAIVLDSLHMLPRNMASGRKRQRSQVKHTSCIPRLWRDDCRRNLWKSLDYVSCFPVMGRLNCMLRDRQIFLVSRPFVYISLV